MAETVRNMGRAGIPILGYHFMPNSVWSTSLTTVLRGGATARSFKMELARNAPLTHGRVYSEAEMWENYDWYMERILPVCEEAGVRMALHPDDPPVEALGGVARLFRNFENFKRAMETHNSPMHGLDFCHGCWSEMRAGAGVLEAIRWFGERRRIFYVHFRDVQGGAEDFTECFVNEGNSDMLKVMLELKDVGFKGFMIDDHVPHMVDDTHWGHRGRAYAIGYMTGLLEAVNKLSYK
jgi:mannonate dehydratase